MERKQITFDSFIRGALVVAGFVGAYLLLDRLSGVLLPFFLAWLIAYLLFPLVKFFQYRCKMRYRVVAILCALITVNLVLTGVFWLMIPPVVEETIRVKDMLIEYVTKDAMMSNIPDRIEMFIHEHLTAEDIKAIVTQEGFINSIKEAMPKIWDMLMQSVNALSGLVTMIMVLIYTLFILIDYEKFTKGWSELLPERYRGMAVRLVADITEGMNKYFRGQGLVAFCVGILFSIGFLIIDFPMAIGLGMFIGLLNMVPYLQLIGFIPAILLAIVKAADTGQSFWLIMLLVVIVFCVVQLIQDTFLTPKIMGKVMGLNAAIILLSLSIWGSLLGILGMIIALPMTTLLLTYYQRYVIRKENAENQEKKEE
ncbi:MAG: AI-2E family transporter [Prevotella sp.]|jgi:predicted PurR-regulated permease PerM|nr:AI-2E family transporter [Prevotella sp.]